MFTLVIWAVGLYIALHILSVVWSWIEYALGAWSDRKYRKLYSSRR